MRRTALALLAFFLAVAPACAESLVLSLSSKKVVIASNFTGTEVVLFGGVVSGGAVGRASPYDLVVTVRGPSRDLTVWRKARVLGIWVNRDSATFPLAPSYLTVLTSRKIGEIADQARRASFGVGLDAALPEPATAGSPLPNSPEAENFQAALIRRQTEAGLYRQDEGGVEWLDANLFRASIPIPANVPIGRFEVDVKLFSGGAVLARQAIHLDVEKSGFEAQVADVAEHQAILYGLGACLLAIVFGWGASIMFRRD